MNIDFDPEADLNSNRQKYPPRNWSPNEQAINNEAWRFFLRTIEFNNPDWMQQWISTHPYAENKEGYEVIYNKLHYKSLMFPLPIKIKGNEEEQDKVYQLRKIFFDVYPLNFQLDLLSYFYTSDQFDIEPTLKLISRLKFDITDEEDWQQVLSHDFFSKTLTRLFSEENFKAINTIESFLGVPIFEETFGNSFILLTYPLIEKGAKFFQWANSDLVTFNAWHQIIFNYSEFKEYYLENRGISLPDSVYVANLRHTFGEIQEKLAQNDSKPSDSIITLEKGLDLYDKVLNYKRIKSDLELNAGNDDDVSPKMKI